MAIKVYVPEKGTPLVFMAGADVSQKDGHLYVLGAPTGARAAAPIQGVFAPGQWTHATNEEVTLS